MFMRAHPKQQRGKKQNSQKQDLDNQVVKAAEFFYLVPVQTPTFGVFIPRTSESIAREEIRVVH